MQKMWYLKDEELKFNFPGLDPIIQQILFKRGFTKEKEVKDFLFSDLNNLINPFLMKDMAKGVERILIARQKGEKVIIYGDYDVDGITSTTILYTYFKDSLEMDVAYYLPNRLKDGYGLNLDVIRDIIAQGYDLLITVDCGITAQREVEYAKTHGLEIIITDHHQSGGLLPAAQAVIDPHQDEDSYPFKDLAGVGVAFKLCQALENKLNGQGLSSTLKEFLAIVSLGTIADLVPLKGENRIIVKEGLKTMFKSKNVGLKALIKKVGLGNKELNTGQVGYILAPPLNAAGRIDDPELGIKLLITDSEKEAEMFAERLVKINKERQDMEKDIFQEALSLVESEVDLKRDRAIVLASENWHPGVIGIVASHLVERFYRPTILIAVKDGIGKGSCRSINNLNIYQALKACADNLTRFGGHTMAAGLAIKADKIEKFRGELNQYLFEHLTRDDLTPKLKIDSLVNLKEINQGFYEGLETLKPYGIGNPRPKLLLNNVSLQNIYPVGKDKRHLKFTLENGLKGIGFGFAEKGNELAKTNVDLVFSLLLNEWGGKKEVELLLDDFNLRDDLNYYPVNFKLDRWLIADKRGCSKQLGYLKNLLEVRPKLAVYVNNLSFCRLIKRKLGDEIIFFSDHQDELDRFVASKRGVLLFTNQAIDKRIKLDDLVFISLPFSLDEMIGMIKIFDNEGMNIHLLYGQKELLINQSLINKILPTDKFLRRFYLCLKAIPTDEVLMKEIKGILAEQMGFVFDQRLINKSLSILTELGLLQYRNDRIRLLPLPAGKLDLFNSIRYNNIVEIINKFKCFSELAFANDLFKLLLEIKRCF